MADTCLCTGAIEAERRYCSDDVALTNPAQQREADIIVLTCTLNPTTRGMVNDEFYGNMKPRALLVRCLAAHTCVGAVHTGTADCTINAVSALSAQVNVARGGLLDYDSTRRVRGCRLFVSPQRACTLSAAAPVFR